MRRAAKPPSTRDDRRLDEVLHAEEVGHEAGARPLVQRLGALELLDAAVVHDRDPVAHDERLVLVVGHEDEGGSEPLLQVLHLDLHLLAQLQVEGGHGLVEEQHVGLQHDRAGEGHALLLAARDLVDPPLAETGEADHLERSRHPLARSRPRAWPRISRPKATLPCDRPVRKERVVLEDGVDRPLVGRASRHVPARDEEAPFVGRFEPGEQPQERRLAAARGTEERQELAGLHLERHAVERDHVAVRLANALDRDRAAHGRDARDCRASSAPCRGRPSRSTRWRPSDFPARRRCEVPPNAAMVPLVPPRGGLLD